MRCREYFGQELRRASAGGILLTENAYAPHTVLPQHEHKNPYFMLVVKGGLIERSGSTEYECRSSTLVFHREGAIHANRFGPGEARCFGLEFDSSLLRKLQWSASDDAARAWVVRAANAVILMKKLRNELAHCDAMSGVMIEGLALTLLAETARATQSSLIHHRSMPRWLNAAFEIIQDESEKPLTVTVVAHRVGVHPVTLARAYKSVFRKTIGEAVRERRLQHAAHLLSDTELPITIIALTSGFSDHSHFTRHFRQQFGLTPQQFRRAG